MAYHIHHTRGIILASTTTGESNRFYKIFTEDLGLVGATAQSVCEVKSKLRYSLQACSLVNFDLVRGREVWRIVSASEEQDFMFARKPNKERDVFLRACSIVLRLVVGEGSESKLFQDLLGLAYFLDRSELSREVALILESLISFRVLVFLGYLPSCEYEQFLVSGDYSIETIQAFEPVRETLLPMINSAIKNSHL